MYDDFEAEYEHFRASITSLSTHKVNFSPLAPATLTIFGPCTLWRRSAQKLSFVSLYTWQYFQTDKHSKICRHRWLPTADVLSLPFITLLILWCSKISVVHERKVSKTWSFLSCSQITSSKYQLYTHEDAPVLERLPLSRAACTIMKGTFTERPTDMRHWLPVTNSALPPVFTSCFTNQIRSTISTVCMCTLWC